MKKPTFHFITSILFLLLSWSTSYSQLQTLNLQLRTLFSNLNPPSNPKPFLYDLSVKVSDPSFYSDSCADTLETAMWYRIYEEMYYSAYDTSKFKRVDSVYNEAQTFQPDTIPMGIMHWSYYRLKQTALQSDTFFDFDTINQILTDKVGRPHSPYQDHDLFSVCPLKASSFFSDPVFSISPQFLFKDVFNNKYYSGQYDFSIDFGDGKGYRNFDPTKTSYKKIVYSSDGEKLIRTKVSDKSSQKTIFLSTSIIRIMNPNPAKTPDSLINLPGIFAGIYASCDPSGISSGKNIIYLSGFDMLDMIPSKSRTIPEIYHQMISNNKVVQMKNMGYNFIVVDWKNSRTDIRFNALYLCNLLEELKCGLDQQHQFVIMGESMGGLVARFAMTFMETSQYLNQDYEAFFVERNEDGNRKYLDKNQDIFQLPFNQCLTAKRHNTRLLITLDSPHQGANIPMSAQHAYSGGLLAFSRVMGVDLHKITSSFNLFMDGKAARQMMLYHISTKNGNSYTPENSYYSFFGQLNDLGGYPDYAKTVAMSNGSLVGTNQLHTFENKSRSPNDRFLAFDSELFCYSLFQKLPLMKVNLSCNSNPNGSGPIYGANLGVFKFQLKLTWFGVRFEYGYHNIINVQEIADLKAYCTGPGGYVGPIKSNMTNFASNSSWSVSKHDLFNLFEYNTTVNKSCITFEAHRGINGFFSDNFKSSLCTDGFQFTLVPVQSALDYGTISTGNVNANIQAEPIYSKLNKVKPDVIIGNPDYELRTNWNHLGLEDHSFRNDPIRNLTNIKAPISEFTYYSCIGYNDQVERGLLNLEIGDEQLYLENATLAWHSQYQTEYEIHVNKRNPYYQYQSGSSIGHHKGIYSKQLNFEIESSAIATFFTDKPNSPSGIGLNYLPPHTGTYQSVERPLGVCCINYLGARMPEPIAKVIKDRDQYLKIYPNPNNGEVLFLTFKLNESGPVQLEIINITGKTEHTENLKIRDGSLETFTTIDIDRSDLPSGIYFIRLSNNIEQLTEKLTLTR